jgi:hypothetical protein
MDQQHDGSSQAATRMSRRTVLAAAASAGLGAAALPFVRVVPSADAAMPVETAAEALSKSMRRLWEEHITWTRLFIVSFAAGLPDLEATTQRLLRNQTDIGNAIKPFYGAAAGTRLTDLLKQHILGAAAVLKEAKAGDSAGVARTQAAWYANADQVAAFLHTANPQHWPLADMQQMMHRHLNLTLAEAVAHLQGRYAQDIAAYDRVEVEILSMADMLTAGIVAQFPRLRPEG